MTTTPVWVPLVVAVFGMLGAIVGTVAGVLLTQRRSDRRELESWNRERERERERWAREDALRVFEDRRRTYIEFYQSVLQMARRIYDRGFGVFHEEDADGDFVFEWNSSTALKLECLRLYASPAVRLAATAAYNACYDWDIQTTDSDAYQEGDFAIRRERYETADRKLYEAIREELGVQNPADLSVAGSREEWRPAGQE